MTNIRFASATTHVKCNETDHMYSVQTGGGHAVATEQNEAVMSASRSVRQTSEHADVWHVERRQQQVASQTHKLGQAYLSNQHTHTLLHSQPAGLVMIALWNRAGHYIFILWFLSMYLFFSLPNLSCRTLDVYHTFTYGAALVRM